MTNLQEIGQVHLGESHVFRAQFDVAQMLLEEETTKTHN